MASEITSQLSTRLYNTRQTHPVTLQSTPSGGGYHTLPRNVPSVHQLSSFSPTDGVGGVYRPWYIDATGTTEQLVAVDGNRGGKAMSAQVVDWLTQGVTLVLVIYFGLHLRNQLRTLKSAVETQKVTIEAQSESIKAQSAVLQDFERHIKIMQQVIDFFDPQAQLQREQAYKERVDCNAATRLDQQKDTRRLERLAAWYAAVDHDDFVRRQFAESNAYATLRFHLPEDLQQEIDGWRTPNMFFMPQRTGHDPRQSRLLQEIARVEREWGLMLTFSEEVPDEMQQQHQVRSRQKP
jgi:hypothetical protein